MSSLAIRVYSVSVVVIDTSGLVVNEGDTEAHKLLSPWWSLEIPLKPINVRVSPLFHIPCHEGFVLSVSCWLVMSFLSRLSSWYLYSSLCTAWRPPSTMSQVRTGLLTHWQLCKWRNRNLHPVDHHHRHCWLDNESQLCSGWLVVYSVPRYSILHYLSLIISEEGV